MISNSNQSDIGNLLSFFGARDAVSGALDLVCDQRFPVDDEAKRPARPRLSPQWRKPGRSRSSGRPTSTC
jgi:hypothetical protein